MPFYFPPSSPLPQKFAWGQNNVTVSARPAADTFNILQLFGLADSGGLFNAPATVDALNNPQFKVTDPTYRMVNVFLNVEILPFQLPLPTATTIYAGLFIISDSTIPAGSWLSFQAIEPPNVTFTPDNRQRYSYSFAIPKFFPLIALGTLPEFTLGLALPLGSIDTINVNAVVNVQANYTG